MKRIFTILAFCLPLFAIGQSIELKPSDDIHREFLVNEISGDDIFVKNISGAAMTINYERVSNTFLSDWGTTFCAGIDCFNHIPESGTLGSLANGESSYLSCATYFGDYDGEGTVEFKIFDANNPAIAETISITYTVTEEITNSKNVVNEYNFSVNPNPTTGFLNIENDKIEEYVVNIFSMTGQLILTEKVFGKSWNGNLSNQTRGIYILTITNEKGQVFRQKINKI